MSAQISISLINRCRFSYKLQSVTSAFLRKKYVHKYLAGAGNSTILSITRNSSQNNIFRTVWGCSCRILLANSICLKLSLGMNVTQQVIWKSLISETQVLDTKEASFRRLDSSKLESGPKIKSPTLKYVGGEIRAGYWGVYVGRAEAIILLRPGLFGIQSSVSKTAKAGGSCEKLWRR